MNCSFWHLHFGIIFNALFSEIKVCPFIILLTITQHKTNCCQQVCNKHTCKAQRNIQVFLSLNSHPTNEDKLTVNKTTAHNTKDSVLIQLQRSMCIYKVKHYITPLITVLRAEGWRILCCADTVMLPPVQNRSNGQDSTTEHLPGLGVLT